MASEFGKIVRVSVFGESHGRAVGAVVSGLPAGEAIDMEALAAFMERRRGGKGALTTARREKDIPVFLSGVKDGKTCASPLCLTIENEDAHSGDYQAIQATPRPGHADATAYLKWKGLSDARGGGHFSGRLTAPLCAAGGIAKQILARRGVFVGAHLLAVAGERDEPFPLYPARKLFEEIAARAFPVINPARGEEMARRIEAARAAGDSVGGVVECAVAGLPGGLGSPMFEGVENRMAAALFGIPAVKGVEFGAGFESADALGSENNDEIEGIADGHLVTRANRAGGILGGITTGMPVTVKCAFKPTPSISRAQATVRLPGGEATIIETGGRHDPCVAVRAVPVVEAVVALTALDLLLEGM